MEKINFIIAKNLADLRRKNKLTQLELAEKLNYSDKAVSKWEQGESLPSVEILYKISKLYNVSLDYIVGECSMRPGKATTADISKKRKIISLLSILSVWFVATILYISFNIFNGENLWMFFCWAVPVSLIVTVIFDIIWHDCKFLFIFISLLFWTLLICFCLQFIHQHIWIILAVGIPLQIATFLWAKLLK